MQVTNQITVDFTKPGLPPQLEGVQGDTARQVCLQLLENGEPWEIPQDVAVVVRYENQKGTGGTFNTLEDGSAVYSISGNALTVVLPGPIFAVAGLTRVQVVLLQGGKQLSVFALQVWIEGEATGEQAGQYTNLSRWLEQEIFTQFYSYIDRRLREQNAFWDSFQQGGTRRDYSKAFSGWETGVFQPKYDLAPTNLSGAFQNMHGEDWDLRQRLLDCGVTLDTSGCTSFSSTFTAALITCIPVLDVTACPQLQATFYGCICHTIEKLIVAETTAYDNNTFRTSRLENIRIEGVIGNDINFSYCYRLTKESLLSILNALKPGVSKTLTLGQDNLDKLTEAEKAIATEKGWSLL